MARSHAVVTRATTIKAVRIAAVDLGSNSFHLVIVDVSGSGAFQVVDREKEMIRLGAGTLSRGRLPAEAMRRGLDTLRRYRRLAQTHRVDKILAVATSAIREASNGEDFLEQVGRAIDVWPKAISGEEEARLIYLAALHSVHLEGRRALVIDIGGGSLELAVGVGSRLEHVVSEKLGVLRLSERFVHSDPLGAKDELRMQGHVEDVLAERAHEVTGAGFETAIGTSGTVLALGALAHEMETGRRAESLHHVTVQASTLRALRKRLLAADWRGRLRMPGLDEERADIIVPGAVLLDTVLERLGVRELTLCEWSLREGILLDYIHSHPRTLARAEAYPDVRRRSVAALAERCDSDEKHGRHVAALSVALFDGTRRRHGLDERERALLEYAALLHDVGHHISYPGHHKHTYYLIKNGDLRGFTPEEVEIVANVARYHRRGHPSKGHASFAALAKPDRRKVRVLAGLLRIADALDRGHRQVVKAVHVREREGTLRIRCQAGADCELELWGVPRRSQLLEEALGVKVRADASAPAAEAELAPPAARGKRG
jgi:exopolyphosphatase/guanosine-5'-triphosphate,3'-diphosphate pyrophosphatase